MDNWLIYNIFFYCDNKIIHNEFVIVICLKFCLSSVNVNGLDN